jgi:hypothetical protein
VKVVVGNFFKPGDHGSMGARSPELRDDVGVEEIHEPLLQRRRRAPAPPAAWRNRNLSSRRIGEEELLESWPGRALESAPLLERDENGGLYTPSGDNLRAFMEARFEKLAEACFCVLHRPSLCGLFCGHRHLQAAPAD